MKITYYLPEKFLTNTELSALYPEWPPEKILAKTGIASRHIVGANETAVDLAERAAKKLFAEYSVSANDIDFILLCTQSPDYKLPSSACILQDRLGIPKNSCALDYDLGCSGFVYGLSLAKGLVKGGIAKNVLLLTAETYSKYIYPMDKSVRTIFGDGAAAVLVDEGAADEIGAFSFGTHFHFHGVRPHRTHDAEGGEGSRQGRVKREKLGDESLAYTICLYNGGEPFEVGYVVNASNLVSVWYDNKLNRKGQWIANGSGGENIYNLQSAVVGLTT